MTENLKIKEYTNRAVFASEMMKKYKNCTSNLVLSDIGSGYGNMKSSAENLGFKWQPFDFVKKIQESLIWDLNHKAPKEAKKRK